MLIAWNAIASEKREFLRDENGAYIPRNEIVEAIESALVFYYIKKDKALENSVKKRILTTDSKPKLKTLAKDIKELVFRKHPYSVKIAEKIHLPAEGIQKVSIERFDYIEQRFTQRYEAEVFKGTIENVKIKGIESVKAALTSYARGLAEKEHEMLKNTVLEPYIIDIQNSIANDWQYTLRIGDWTKTPYKGNLLFFWRIKEVREKLLKKWKLDIRPHDILFVPKFKEFLGWCEIR